MDLMRAECPLAADADRKTTDECMCRYHRYELVRRVCGGKLGVDDLRKRLGSFVVERSSTAVGGITDQIAAEPETGEAGETGQTGQTAGRNDGGILSSQHTLADAQRNVEWQRTIDRLAAGRSYTKADLAAAARKMAVERPSLRLPQTSIDLHWWQVVHAAELATRYEAGEEAGTILADQVGMGKTYTVLGFLTWYARKKLGEYNEAAARHAAKQGPDAEPLRPKPILLAVPSGLVKQWVTEIRRYTKVFRIIAYHGDARSGTGNSSRFVKKDVALHHRFEKRADDEDEYPLVVTTHDTFRERHGPKALARHRGGVIPRDFGKRDVIHPPPTEEDAWRHDMSDEFGILVIDEAHGVRNRYRQTNQTFKWLRTEYTVLMTATPIWGHAGNLTGLIWLVEERGRSEAADVALSKKDDPWTLADDDQRAEYRYAASAWERWCLKDETLAEGIVEAADADVDDAARASTLAATSLVGEQARRLRLMFARFVIRADYHSSCEELGQAGDSIPGRVVYSLQTPFSADGLKLYAAVADRHLHKLHVKSPQNGQIILNGDKLRMLYLTALNPTYEFSDLLRKARGPLRAVGRGGRKITHALLRDVTIELRKSQALRDMCEELGVEPFSRETLRRRADGTTAGVMDVVLGTVVGHSVRLRALLAGMADDVIRRQEKVLVWVQYPAEQKLVVAMLDLLGIKAAALLASLAARQRSRLIAEFNRASTEGIQVLVCSYKVSITGHNMQHACSRVHMVDPAPTEATLEQTVGRVQRLGQRKIVHVTMYLTPSTHNTTTLARSAAQIASNVLANINDDELVRVFGGEGMSAAERRRMCRHEGFVLVGGRLWHESQAGFPEALEAAEERAVERFDAGDFGVWVAAQTHGDVGRLVGGVGSEFVVATDRGRADLGAAAADAAADAELMIRLQQLATLDEQPREEGINEEGSEEEDEADEADEADSDADADDGDGDSDADPDSDGSADGDGNADDAAAAKGSKRKRGRAGAAKRQPRQQGKQAAKQRGKKSKTK